MQASIANTAISEPIKGGGSEKSIPTDHDSPSHQLIEGDGIIAFEEYLHYAALQRRVEAGLGNEKVEHPIDEKKSWFHRLSDHKGANVNVDVHEANDPPMTEFQQERADASRALRLASWASVFYLITTDILGPFNAPFAISQVGWVPGVILYFFMGLIALYTGLILWRLFIRLDSLRYPVKSYGDIAERIFGKSARHVVSLLQSLQLLVNVATICLGNGQALSQMTKSRLCFSVCIVIWALLGMVIGQIRTLKNYGWLANSAVWINLLIIFLSMGFIAHSPPNFDSAKKSLNVDPGPVMTTKFGHLPLAAQVNGIMNMVFAYGGAMIFPEMMAEMRRPMDFWKGMTMAQGLIFAAYLLYGAFVYAFQGQFTLPLAFQGVSKFSWQTVGNALALVTGIIAAGLYGNIGIKVVYINIIEGWFNGPPLMSRRGRLIWTPLVFAYWALAFVIGSAIPQIQTITGLIAAVAIMQFTYTFPPLLRLGYDVITDAMDADREYSPGQGIHGRIDNWNQWSRWKRGLFGGRWYFKLFNLLMSLGGLAMACLGMWGAGVSIKTAFDNSAGATSFGCAAPV
ncbi:transmembrane amino acid transporter protein-domain-containing protein [Crucibulum laeve]|uniref:Transmembrane amino acid transporter protein-domain-containing protein n=1 Tax=Crucibulum laeve TaxID=68775 RepID=A0A5C3LHF9_9AGAR|nr:transmembrane amino acid transporter protein-domain-containing protein [Crucibulum laeve]